MPEKTEKLLYNCFHPKEGKPNLYKITPNPKRMEDHLKKSHNNLTAMKLMFDHNLFDWTIICGYYAMYHAVLAALHKIEEILAE